VASFSSVGSASDSSVADTPATADHGFHRHHESQGHAVESICRVLRGQGCQVAARTYRSWNRDFTAAGPNRTRVTNFTYVRTWAGFTYVAFIVDVYAQRIVAWHAATTKQTDLVMIPLRMALWQRDREGHPPSRAS
jgi:transposase InsO family protein